MHCKQEGDIKDKMIFLEDTRTHIIFLYICMHVHACVLNPLIIDNQIVVGIGNKHVNGSLNKL